MVDWLRQGSRGVNKKYNIKGQVVIFGHYLTVSTMIGKMKIDVLKDRENGIFETYDINGVSLSGDDVLKLTCLKVSFKNEARIEYWGVPDPIVES